MGRSRLDIYTNLVGVGGEHFAYPVVGGEHGVSRGLGTGFLRRLGGAGPGGLLGGG